MNKITDEEFKEIVDGYNTGTLILGVNLAKGRQFLCDTLDKGTIITSLLISLVLPICIFGTSIYSFGGWGILYSLIVILFYWSYMGICSMPLKIKRTIYIISIIALIASFFFGFEISVTLTTTFFSFASTYLYYENIKNKIVKLATTNKEIMLYMLNLYIICITKGENDG